MARVPVSFIKTTTAKIDIVPVVEGQYILVSDPATTQSEYVAYDDADGRHIISDIVDLAHDADRQLISPSSRKFYYIVDTGELWRYIDNSWIRINSNSSDGSIVQVSTIDHLPSVGDAHTLYAILSTKELYYWDDNLLHYYCAGSDWRAIDIIDGNFL